MQCGIPAPAISLLQLFPQPRQAASSPPHCSRICSKQQNARRYNKRRADKHPVIYFAALAMSHRAVKATGSWIAVSESILRFMSIPASFRPCMKVE